jgi:hypothetical protein
MPIRLYIVAVILLFVLQTDSFGGAWTRKTGSFYAKLSYSLLATNEFYTRDGVKIMTADFNTQSMSFYGEYGLWEGFTGSLQFPFVRTATFETTESQVGIGDASFGLKYGIVRAGSTPFAVSATIGIPTGDKTGTTLLKDGSGGSVYLPTGDGEFNIWLQLHLSHSLYPVPAYISLDGGINLRTRGLTNEYQFGVQAGYTIGRFWIQGSLRTFGPVDTPKPDLILGGVQVGIGEGVQYSTYGLSTAYEIAQGLRLSAEAFSAFGRITNIYSGVNIMIGVSLER